jgi:uncharacterized membrane protein
MSAAEIPLITSDDEKNTTRTEAFSDGVFAIAITLLALEVRVPSHEQAEAAGGLFQALLNQWPSYFAFLTSFLTILIMWVNHHRLFRMFRRVDHIFLILNGLLLMGISLVPFTSALLAEYIDDAHDAQIGTMVYAGIFVLIALFFNAVWRYAAYKRRLIDHGVPQAAVDAVTRAYRFGPLLYLAAGLLAVIHAALGAGLILALAIFYALPSQSGETLHVQ